MVGPLLLALSASERAATNDELRSDLRSAFSLVSETELLLDQIEGDRLLSHFRSAHADYLRQEAKRQATEARNAKTESDSARQFAYCAEQLDLLSKQLESISEHSDVGSLARERENIKAIKKALIAAGADR
jgi:hypothetical protein